MKEITTDEDLKKDGSGAARTPSQPSTSIFLIVALEGWELSNPWKF